MNDLELLPPRTKYECPKCKRHFSRLWKCKDKIKRCGNCKRTLPTNKFYIPLTERKNLMGKVGKFSLNELEKEQLAEQYKSQGLSSEQAWRKVHYLCRILRLNYYRMKGRQTIQRNREIKEQQKTEEERKKFLEGLK